MINSLEAEYSFLAPTWKLPAVATPSMYAGTYSAPFLAPDSTSDPDWMTRNNTLRNSGYIPDEVPHRSQPAFKGRPRPPVGPPDPPPRKQQESNDYFETVVTPSFDHDEYDHQPPPPRAPPPKQKRVQIIDHNHRQTPSTDHQSGRDSVNSFPTRRPAPVFNSAQSKSKPVPERQSDDHQPNSAHSSGTRPANAKIHPHPNVPSASNPGSYVNAHKDQQRRTQDFKEKHKTVLNDYKNFALNGGFGPAFGSAEHHTHREKLDIEQKRKSYSKVVRETNQYKIEGQKRLQNNGGQERQRPTVGPLTRYRPSEPIRSHFLSAQEVREFEQRIKREHDANCKCSLHSKSFNSSA